MHEVTSPRVWGEVEIRISEFRVRGRLRESALVERPLTPTLTPRAGRGSSERSPLRFEPKRIML
jgi:hypothetical protein